MITTEQLKELIDAINKANKTGASKKVERIMMLVYSATLLVGLCEPELAKLLIDLKQNRIERTKSDALKNKLTTQINKIVDFYKSKFNVNLLTFSLEVQANASQL